MRDLIFANQRELSKEKYIQYATELGLDIERFKKDMESADVKKLVDTDSEQAASLGLTGTPGFFINGRYLRGAKPFEDFKALIDEELARN